MPRLVCVFFILISRKGVKNSHLSCQSQLCSSTLLYAHKSHHATEENTLHPGHAIYPERQQIIYWLGGHCATVPLFFSTLLPTASASIDHCLRKTCLCFKCCHKNPAKLSPAPRHQWGWELILDTKLGHFYHGLSSIYNLKAWPEASIAGLFIGVLLGSGE